MTDTLGAVTDFVLGGAGAVIPEAALDYAATLLIDTVGVAAGAVPMQAGRIARDHAARYMMAEGADAAPILFDGRRAGLPGAAWAGATQIDNLDAHDGFNPTKGHIGCAVVPALFALARAQPDLAGLAALAHMVRAYEVAGRAGLALHASVSDYHTSGAWNALGVAAMGVAMRGQDATVLAHALGIAEYHGPRSQMMREIANPTMLHDGSGMGAFVGIQAALLAEEGFHGAPAITVTDAPAHWADLGTRWTVNENYIKPYPICRWAHAAIDGIRLIRDRDGLTPDAVERIEIGCFAEAAALWPRMPRTTSEAQYALAFPVATMLRFGEIGPDRIMGAALTDPETAALVGRITCHVEDRHQARFPSGRWSDVTVITRDGRRLTSGDMNARGGPQDIWPPAKVEEKFHLMTGQVLPAQQARAIWSMRDRLLDPATRFSELADLVQKVARDD